ARRDGVARVLLGLGMTDGSTAWERDDIRTDAGTATAVFAVSTPDDLTGPARVNGAAYAPDPDDDQRLVQISADRSARVIDAATGDVVVAPRPGVADTDSPILAHDGRLIVSDESTNNTQRLLAYDLSKLGEPQGVTSIGGNVRVSDLTPCGTDRVCWIETTGYDGKATQVAAINLTDSSGIWRRPLPNTDRLVPVGDHLLASQNTSPPTAALLD